MRCLFINLLLFIIYLRFIFACDTNLDCGQCHFCDKITRKCIQVTPNTDPFDDCGTKCKIKMVCGNEPYCIYQSMPQCDCEWSTGVCKEEILIKPKFISEIKLDLPSPPPTPKIDIELNGEDILLIRELIRNHKTNKKIAQENTFVETYASHIHVGLTIIIMFSICCISWIVLKIKEDMKKSKDIESQKDQ
jgi:hypothetical protein